MKSSREIEEICNFCRIKNYTISEDGSIDVDGDVNLIGKDFYELPLTFNRVSGYFDCSHNYLTILKGSPKYVGDFFTCSKNNLSSLEYSPESIGYDFSCIGNEIRDLYGISDNIGRYLYCDDTPISSIITKKVDIDFIKRFDSYKVLKDGRVDLKRLKYLMELSEMEYDIEKIKEYYEII